MTSIKGACYTVAMVETTGNKFGEFIRRKREAAGITQEECAKALGWHSRASYHKIETGKLEWKLRDFIIIAQLLGREPGALLSEWIRMGK